VPFGFAAGCSTSSLIWIPLRGRVKLVIAIGGLLGAGAGAYGAFTGGVGLALGSGDAARNQPLECW